MKKERASAEIIRQRISAWIIGKRCRAAFLALKSAVMTIERRRHSVVQTRALNSGLLAQYDSTLTRGTR